MGNKIGLLAALVAASLTATAQTGPTSTLYLTIDQGAYSYFQVVQGNSVSAPVRTSYGTDEFPIAVWGDVRTDGNDPTIPGGQYTLGLTPTGTSYAPLPGFISQPDDGTSDGTHNYVVDTQGGIVYQTARDFTNVVPLFNSGLPFAEGITYDPVNKSLWICSYFQSTFIDDFSLSGTLLSSFDVGHSNNFGLAMDPADHTLWLTNNSTLELEQYSTTGTLLSLGPFVSGSGGAEFNLAPTTTPEPGTLIMFGSGILSLAGILRRKIKL